MSLASRAHTSSFFLRESPPSPPKKNQKTVGLFSLLVHMYSALLVLLVADKGLVCLHPSIAVYGFRLLLLFRGTFSKINK